MEIADAVFARSADSVDNDASVRVHIHRLRRKLDEHYRGVGAGEPLRLVIPKADYRLAIEPRPVATFASALPTKRSSRTRLALAAVLLAAVAGAVGWGVGHRSGAIDKSLDGVRQNALWSPVISNSRRVAIVVGDYYIFGESDARGDVSRLVREFDVNSPKDLERKGDRNPPGTGAIDLDLHYLPVGVGNAIRIVTPILLTNQGGGVVPSFVFPSSQLSPELVKYTNLVYLGYLSGLGSLRDPMFSASRFAIGNSYDDIVDGQTGQTYSASNPLDDEGASTGQDYAIVSTFHGVTGNVIVVIAGTRDAGLMQAAEFVARPETLAKLARIEHGSTGVEALLAVESLDNVGLRARLITASPRRRETDWSGREAQVFPDSLPTATAVEP